MQKKLSDKELREFFDRVMDKPHFRAYVTLSNKFYDLCDAFDRATMDISGDTDEFKNFMTFSKQLFGMIEDMERMMIKIDPERAEAVKEEQSASTKAALENFVRNKPQ